MTDTFAARQYGEAVTILMPAMLMPTVPLRKRSLTGAEVTRPTPPWLDEATYRSRVLRLPAGTDEGEVDDGLAHEVQELGVVLPRADVSSDGVSSSLSASTVNSGPSKSSFTSQSTAPTSCASSECRPRTSRSERCIVVTEECRAPSLSSEAEKKRHLSFRNGLRKMTGFKKRKPMLPGTSSISLQSSPVSSMPQVDYDSLGSPLQSPSSIRSSKSFFAPVLSTKTTTYESGEPSMNAEALQRSVNCRDMVGVRSRQLDERSRFLEYQASVIAQARMQRDHIRATKAKIQSKAVTEQSQKNDKAVEDLELRQLEDELKMLKEHETEKRAATIRLRHMEAYCQNPTPPSTPVESTFSRRSVDSGGTLAERHVTQKHYENLAQQYRERDTMDSLHASKINVLRGKQKKVVENFTRKRENELEQLQRQHQRELDNIDREYRRQDADIRQAFDVKKVRLEHRWKLQALIERTKTERRTGLQHEALPDVTMTDG